MCVVNCMVFVVEFDSSWKEKHAVGNRGVASGGQVGEWGERVVGCSITVDL